MIRRFLLLAVLGVAALMPIAANAQGTASAPYLFDLLAKPAFNASFDAMLKGEKNVDGWLQNKSGPASPARNYVTDGKPQFGGSLCKPHDCGENQFYYLFTQDGSRAVGLLIKANTQRWFGNPSAAEKSTLLQVSRSRS